MAKKNRARTDGIIDCACVIHGTGYSWEYVEKLYSMLTRLIPSGMRFHVYTEHDRSVPPHMIKHILEEWPGISGPKKSWWYKMQLFNSHLYNGDMLYFDLDVVLVREMDWVRDLPTDYFWSIRDFRYLQRSLVNTINSSVMWFNVGDFAWVWDDFVKQDINKITKQFPGDQDYISHVINHNKCRFFDNKYFQSYRWQVMDGGYDFQKRKHKAPGHGAKIDDETAVVVVHGKPKPHEVHDPKIRNLWK